MAKELNRKQIAKKIASLAIENVALTLQAGQTPNLHWNLEKAIEDALLYTEKITERRLKENLYLMVKEFDNENGNTHQ